MTRHMGSHLLYCTCLSKNSFKRHPEKGNKKNVQITIRRRRRNATIQYQHLVTAVRKPKLSDEHENVPSNTCMYNICAFSKLVDKRV